MAIHRGFQHENHRKNFDTTCFPATRNLSIHLNACFGLPLLHCGEIVKAVLKVVNTNAPLGRLSDY